MNRHLTRLTAAVAAGLLLGGCGGGGNGSSGIPPISSVNPLSTGKLQFAVGTANIYGVPALSGLNVVSTYRRSNGISNVLLDSPTITGPFTLPATAGSGGLTFDPDSSLPQGPAASEVSGGTIGSTPQGFGISAMTTFGQSGGVFTNGFSPGNSNNNGLADSYKPYLEPLYNDPANPPVVAGTPVAPFSPWGGPPSFDPNKDGMGLRDGLSTLAQGVVGIPEGFTSFSGVTVKTGTYNLNVVVPTGFNGPTPTNGTVSATATLNSTALLPTLTTPALALDGNGGGSVVLPASYFTGGVSEIYIEIIDLGNGGPNNCQGQIQNGQYTGTGIGSDSGAGPTYYTIVAKTPGTYSLPDKGGPNNNISGGVSGLQASPSICTAAQNTVANGGTASQGDNYSIQLIGLDYDMYGATFPITTNQTPTITGGNGQADITLSVPVSGTSP